MFFRRSTSGHERILGTSFWDSFIFIPALSAVIRGSQEAEFCPLFSREGKRLDLTLITGGQGSPCHTLLLGVESFGHKLGTEVLRSSE